jgi:hypothetical protein
MLLPTRRQLAVIVLLLCASLGLGSASVVAQKKKSSAPAKKAAAAQEATEAAKPIAVHEFSVEGVDVALMEVTRTAPDVLTVKWEYRNKTGSPQELADDSKGWSDPYRLSWNTYLLGADGKTQIKIMKDSGGKPVAALHGAPNQLAITVPAKKTLKTWAKYSVPADTKTVTVVLTGTEPFENVEVKEPPPPNSK